MNIKARLTLLFTLLVTSIMLIFCVAIYFFYDQYREQQFFSYLRERANTITSLIEDIKGITGEDIQHLEEGNSTILLGEEVTIYDSRDSIIYDSGKELFPVSQKIFSRVREGKELQFREGNKEVVMLRHVHVANQKPWVVVAYAEDIIGLKRQTRLRDILALGWVLSLLVVSGAGWIFSTDALKPVSDIIAQVNTISAGNLHQRLRVGRPRDELAQLALTFNLMLNRLELAFASQRSFVSHASHELRTPLSVMMGEVEVTLMKERDKEVYQQTLARTLLEVKNLSELLNRLLELARTDAVAKASFKKIRLDEVLWQAQSYVNQKHPEYRVEISFGELPLEDENLYMRGDETLLRSAFVNLMDNACKYSEDKKVAVFLEVQLENLLIHFIDHGIGIEPEHIPYLFETFYRIPATRNEKGFGIGLALVERIIHVHQGSIDVSSTPGTGSTFLVRLPIF